MNETIGPFQEVAFIAITAFPFVVGYAAGYAHRVAAVLWIAVCVGYKRGRYGKLD